MQVENRKSTRCKLKIENRRDASCFENRKLGQTYSLGGIFHSPESQILTPFLLSNSKSRFSLILERPCGAKSDPPALLLDDPARRQNRKKYKFMQNERPDFIKLFSEKKEQYPRRWRPQKITIFSKKPKVCIRKKKIYTRSGLRPDRV